MMGSDKRRKPVRYSGRDNVGDRGREMGVGSGRCTKTRDMDDHITTEQVHRLGRPPCPTPNSGDPVPRIIVSELLGPWLSLFGEALHLLPAASASDVDHEQHLLPWQAQRKPKMHLKYPAVSSCYRDSAAVTPLCLHHPETQSSHLGRTSPSQCCIRIQA